jgi:hypothetical protein
VGFVAHPTVGTVCSAYTRVVAETNCFADSETTIDWNYGSID